MKDSGNPNFDFYSDSPIPPEGDPTDKASFSPGAEEASSSSIREIERSQARRSFSRIGFATVAMTVGWYGASEMIAYLLKKHFSLWVADNLAIASFLVGTLPLYVIGVPLLYLILRKLPVSLPEAKPFSVRLFLCALAVCFTASSVGSNLGTGIMELLSRLTGREFSNQLSTLVPQIPLWLTALVIAVLAPIFEELVFRKLMIDRLSRFGGGLAVLFSAVLFGLFHGNFYQVFYATGIGLVLGYVYLYTGKLRYTIFIHGVFNLIGGVLSSLVLRELELDSLLSSTTTEELLAYFSAHTTGVLLLFLYLILQFLLTVAGIIFLAKHYRSLHFEKAPEQLERGERMPAIFGGCGVILCLVVFALMFLLNLLQL